MDIDSQIEFDAVVDELTATSSAVRGMMFGMPSLKQGGKAFAGYYKGAMVFKLGGAAHARALGLTGSQLFDPMGGRPMKEWVVVPAEHAPQWLVLARDAQVYVAGGK
ncbi:MAG TPA: hypothetical protein VH591_11695 [Ktedonobacterales bacterium]|jgi:hypothetical protein